MTISEKESIKRVREAWCERAAKHDPQFAEMCNRIYDLPGCAASYKGLLSLIAAGLLGMDDTFTCNHINAVRVSATTGHPWWYVPKPVVELVGSISLDADNLYIDADMFTHPSMWFLLPVGALRGDEGEDIHWLNITLITDEVKKVTAAHYNAEPAGLNGRVALQCTAWSADGVMFHVSVEADKDGKVSRDYLDRVPVQVTPGFESDAESRWSSRVLLPMCLNIVTLMTAKPELVEKSDKKTGVIKKTDKTKWLPRVLGRNYARRYVEAGKAGGAVSPHKRSRHWKRVPYGPGRTKRRYMLIEETWVGVKVDATE